MAGADVGDSINGAGSRMEEIMCKFCSKNFNSQESLAQHIKAKHDLSEEKRGQTNKNKIRKYGIVLILAAAIVIFAYTFYVGAQSPGRYDELAKCLTEKGVVVYGNDFCQYTAKQLNYFGKSKQYLNYVKCSENETLCNEKGVRVTPTWEIKGQTYPQVQTFERLSQLSGCKI